jgi:hypothetical protein
MASWYKVTSADWDIQDEFASRWLASGGPKDAALFSVRNIKARNNDFYFSPGAARIAEDIIARYAGTECSRPVASGSSILATVSLLVGDQSAFSLLTS